MIQKKKRIDAKQWPFSLSWKKKAYKWHICSFLTRYLFHFVMDQYVNVSLSRSAGVGHFFMQILTLIKIILQALKSLLYLFFFTFVEEICSVTIQPPDGKYTATLSSVFHTLTHTLTSRGGVVFSKSERAQINQPDCVTDSTTQFVTSVLAVLTLSLLKWTVLLINWMQLVSWKSGNTSMQMVRTVNDMFRFVFSINIP